MYKIYLNENLLTLKSTKDISVGDITSDSVMLVKYDGTIKQIKGLLDKSEKKYNKYPVILHHFDLNALYKDLLKVCNLVEASGGIVTNPSGEILFIYRRGFWDLPKGKLEKGETKRETALREIKEETGVKGLKITDKIGTTFHIFYGKSGNRILKKSYWYAMTATKQRLVPQKEEDIELAEWLSLDQFITKKPVYANIKHIISKYQESIKL